MPNSDLPTPEVGRIVRQKPWDVNRRVIGALLIRELLTRYGRNNIGFLWLFVEPMLVTLIIAIIWSTLRSVHGSTIPIVAFAVTGYSSMLLWRGVPSRCIDALRVNQPLLFHRPVTVMDIYFSRIALETVAVTTSFVVISLIFYAVAWLDAPEDVLQVLGGWALLAWLGFGLALTVGGLSEKVEVVGKLWPPFSFMLFPLSGFAFLADALPQGFREIVLWLPMLNALEFLREGWFGSQFRAHYDIPYVVVFNIFLTFVGLSLARQAGLNPSDE
jgi:ABC-2 type transport system permease protein/capsular polysaccharide transport system permease protein